MGVPAPDDFLEPLVPGEFAASSRFVAMSDILGFKVLAEALPAADLATRLDLLIRQAERSFITVHRYPGMESQRAHYRPQVCIFSDTILTWSEDQSPVTAPDSRSFFHFVAAFFGSALKLDLPLRTGIAFGDCVIEPERSLFAGQPLIDAYLTEEAQDWIGVACHPSCFNAPDASTLSLTTVSGWQVGPLIEFPIPQKRRTHADFELKHTIDWPFWSQGARSVDERVDLGALLKEKLHGCRGSQFEERWQRTADYYATRIAPWTVDRST